MPEVEDSLSAANTTQLAPPTTIATQILLAAVAATFHSLILRSLQRWTI
jgi:hypothetical protein